MVEQDLPGLRWGRSLVAAIIAEVVVLIPNAVVVNTVENPFAILEIVSPIMLFLLFIFAGYWCAKGSSRPVGNGLITGLWGVLIYLVFSFVIGMAGGQVSLEDNLRPAYLLTAGVKVVGGAIGAWLVARKAA